MLSWIRLLGGRIIKKPVLISLVVFFILCSVIPISDRSSEAVNGTINAPSNSKPKVLALYSSEADLNLTSFLAHEINVATRSYNVSVPFVRTILPYSLDDFQAIWWFASSPPSISPLELFGNSTSNLNSWLASEKSFFAITEHLNQLDMPFREILGMQEVSPLIYPSNGSEAIMDLEVTSTKVFPGLQNGSKVTVSSKAGFFVPKTDAKLVAKVSISLGGMYSNLTSGLLVSPDLSQLSALLSISVSPNWLESLQFNVSHRKTGRSYLASSQSLDVLDFLQIVAENLTLGENPATPSSPDAILDPFILVILGLLVFPLLFLGFKTGRIQRFVFGFYASTIFFIAHVTYSPSKRRLDRQELLTNELRSQIVDILQQKGREGAHIRELKRALGCGVSPLLWHLQTLDDFGIVSSTKLGQYHVFYLTELADVSDISLEVATTIRGKTTKKICQVMVQKPKKPLNVSEIAKNAGCRVETARYHLKKLEEVGVIKRIQDNAKVFYAIHPDLISKIQPLISS